VLWVAAVYGSSADGAATALARAWLGIWTVDPDEGYLVIFEMGEKRPDSEEMLLWRESGGEIPAPEFFSSDRARCPGGETRFSQGFLAAYRIDAHMQADYRMRNWRGTRYPGGEGCRR
jgi:hypothetical protein